MLSILLLHACLGLGLALAMLCIPRCRRHIDRTAEKIGMGIGYARIVWLGGTIVAWPVALYVLATGRLVLVADETGVVPADGVAGEAKQDEAALGDDAQRAPPFTKPAA